MRKIISKTLRKVLNKIGREMKINQPFKAYDFLVQDAAKTSAEFIKKNISNTMVFSKSTDIFHYTLNLCLKNGLFIELGVFNGTTINFQSNILSEIRFFGFDSFEGLKEDWKGSHLSLGAFNRYGKLPKVNKNVTLIKGWIQDTLPSFLKEKNNKISYVHFDIDTYESTRDALNIMKPYFQKGSILVFNEFFGYPNWENGEFKAFNEFIKQSDFDFKYIAFTNMQAAVKLE